MTKEERFEGYDDYGRLCFDIGGVKIFIMHLITYFEKVVEPLAEVVGKRIPDYLEAKEYGELMHGFLYLDDLKPEEFMLAYELTQKACDEHEGLARYREDFEKAFKADSRFLEKSFK